MKETTIPPEIKDPPSPAERQEVSHVISEIEMPLPRSYQPVPWSLVNRVLDVIDRRTRGKAGSLQRLVSYLFFGGLAAGVNLLVFDLVFSFIPFPFGISLQMRNVVASLLAAECSIMANFLLNDRFTFRHLPGATRPWWQRCLRFHATCIIGSLLTFVLEFALFSLAHLPALFAEMIAILIVLIYNFSFHHFFTYRSLKHA